jgi:hypothetical protein
MKHADVTQSIEHIRSALSAWIQADLVVISKQEISWRDYRTGVFSNEYYPLEYQWLLDHRQYSFLLRDSSFLQFYYAFDDAGILSARAALYPKPLSIKVSEDELFNAAEIAQDMEEQELSDHFLNVVEEMEKRSIYPSNTSHVRFDFDREVRSHSKAHIQFGGLNDVRIEADFVPMPYAFVEIIASAFQGFQLSHDAKAQAHSRNKALRKVEHGCLIHLAHTK